MISFALTAKQPGRFTLVSNQLYTFVVQRAMDYILIIYVNGFGGDMIPNLLTRTKHGQWNRMPRYTLSVLFLFFACHVIMPFRFMHLNYTARLSLALHTALMYSYIILHKLYWLCPPSPSIIRIIRITIFFKKKIKWSNEDFTKCMRNLGHHRHTYVFICIKCMHIIATMDCS